jgi:ribosomal protein S18 acetylase RimI-like enzyme
MITENKIKIVEADLNQLDHAENFLRLTAAYMADPMGEAEPWNDEQKNTVIREMKDHPGALVVFAKADNEYIGICTCFYAYSTFLAKPLLNIHDIYVSEPYRSNGIGRKMIEAIEAIARQKGCGKITLEVRKDNLDARDLYKRQGFKEAPHSMFFWIKYL